MLLFEIWSLGHPPFPDRTPMQVCCVLVAKNHPFRCVSVSALCNTYLMFDVEGSEVLSFYLD